MTEKMVEYIVAGVMFLGAIIVIYLMLRDK